MKVNYVLSLILLLFSFSTLCSCIYAIKKYRENPTKAIAWLIIFSFTVFLYCFSYSMVLISETLKVMLIFNTIKIMAIAILQSVTLCMVITILYPDKELKLKTLLLIFLIPFLTIVFRLTSDYHALYYYNFSINTDGAFNTLQFELGPWNYIYGGYGVIISLFAIGLLVKDIFINRHNHSRSVLIIFAVIFPLTLGILTIMEIYVCGVILLPYAFPFTAMCFYIAVFRHKLFNIIPLAYRKVFEWSEAGIVVVDNNLEIIGYNPAFNKIFPDIDISTSKYNIDMLINKYSQLDKTIFSDEECRIKVSNGDEDRYYTVNNSYLYDGRDIKSGQILSFVDVTELAKAMSQLSELAFEDSLTGAYTRRYFEEHAKREIDRAKRYDYPISMVMMDFDHFKNVNDRYGHLAGDEVLKTIVNVCTQIIRENDIFCRYGGEEFAILLPDTDAENANVLCERIRALVESTEILFNDQKIKITISIGLTGVTKVTSESLDLMIKHADTALYTAKVMGRNNVQFLLCQDPMVEQLD